MRSEKLHYKRSASKELETKPTTKPEKYPEVRTNKCSENSRRKIRRKFLSSTRSLLLTTPTAFLVLFSITLALLINPAEGAPFFFDTLRDLLSPFRPNRFDHSIIFTFLLIVFQISQGSPLGEQFSLSWNMSLWKCVLRNFV